MLEEFSNLVKKYNKKVWVMFNDDGSDKIFTKYLSKDLFSKTFCFITDRKIYLLVCELDSQNINGSIFENNNNVKCYVYKSNKDLEKYIEDIIAEMKFPEDISLSYSTMSDNNVDILTHGAYIYLTKLLKLPYKKYNKKVKFSSAENLIYDVASKKTKKQIERLKILAKTTNEVLSKTFEKIKVGNSEKEIVKITNDILNDTMNKIINDNKYEIESFGLAWDNCPIVLTGENLAKGGHSLPSDKKLNYGDTIYFDFGIKAIYIDGETLYTDMQRMGYALKKKEKVAPKSVMKVFETLVNAIEDGIDELKPDKKAYLIDEVVRKKILNAGYIDYNHATGHPVGLQVHDIGAIISLKNSKRSRLPLIENGIYTIEPRINIANGGSIEEMVLVTKFGGVPLTDTQKEIFLVK